MLEFLKENLGSLLILLGVAAFVCLMVVSLVKSRKKGGACSCGCSDCPMSASCRQGQKNK